MIDTINPLINPHGGLFLESTLGWGFIRGGGLSEGGGGLIHTTNFL